MPGKLFTPRQILVYATVAALIFLSRPVPGTFLAGCTLAAIGIAIRAWGCGHLRKNEDLVTSGPYAYVKHPLYLGTFLVALGGVLAAGSPELPGLLVWVLVGPAFLIGFFGFYLPRKRRTESRRMAERFGDRYPAWAAAVPDFVPSLRAWPQASRSRWNWRIYRGNNELEMDLLIVVLFAAMFLVGTMSHGT